MTFPLALSPPIAGAFAFRAYSGFGILGADIPATGDSGGSPVLNDGISPDAEYHWRVETQPSAGALTIYPDLTFEFDATGIPDGSYPWAYRLFETGVDQGTATVAQTVGSSDTLVSVANSVQANQTVAASIKQMHLVSVANSVQANVASPVSVTQSNIAYASIANSAQVARVSSASIKQSHLVRAASSSQSNAASAVNVGSTQVTVANSRQANRASSAGIRQTHLITISDSLSATHVSPAAIHVGNPIADQPAVFTQTIIRIVNFKAQYD